MLRTKALNPDFGAEVLGFSPDDCADTQAAATLIELFERFSVLVLRGLHLTDQQQLALSRQFGPLEKTKTGTLGTGTELIFLTNLDSTGKLVSQTHRQWLEGLGNQLWHSDSSFKPVPAHASLLSAHLVPPDGGETQFASTRVAYQKLTPEQKAFIQDKTGVHDYAYSRSLISPDLMTDAERAELPPVRHPLVRRHPVSGEKGIYIGSHLARIDGMPDNESRALIDELLVLATSEDATYKHHWREGDLVIWDNRFVLHRGRPYSPDHPRRMVRTTVAGYPDN